MNTSDYSLSNEELTEGIQSLKDERSAIILAHNYQIPEIQDIADYIGDSFGLSKTATDIDAELIVFCGVHFMAESAAILNPDKRVLLPEINAGCEMADMATAKQVIDARSKHPDASVVSYVNTTAEVKAESDICCTSSNAVKVIQSLGDRQIIYLPDQNLARYAAKLLDRELILWKGYCYVHHEWIKLADVLKLKEDHTEALVVAHPECTLDVLDISDHIGSTSGILKFVKDTDAEEFIVLTEMGMGHRLHKENPGKKIYMLEQAICANMKLTTLLSLYKALKYDQHHITVPEPTASRARRALERMMEII